MPVPAFIVPESVVMISIPIAGLLAIVVVEAVMVVMIPVVVMIPIIVVVPVLITLIVMVPIVLILRLSQRYAKKQSDKQCCGGSKPASNVHEILPVKVRRIEIQFNAEAKPYAVRF